ncbi:MAG: radical SAM protein [bacterium]|nr:radical SAM protein [bacterium]
MSQIYGPVCSRRLGLSLGIDIVPYKTCTLDCVYCQLGRTTCLTTQRHEWIKRAKVVRELKNKLCILTEKVDYITISGSGEPTLNLTIGSLISEIKSMTKIPVALLTNGTLLYRSSVRKDIKIADIVIPSLDAATQKTFEVVNRPSSGLKIEKIIHGIEKFRQEFQGKIWLEIMLVRGLNDNISEITKLKNKIACINPDKVQLNTVVRPPSEDFAKPLEVSKLQEIKEILGDRCEVIPEFRYKKQNIHKTATKKAILDLIRRRPVTQTDIATLLGIHKNEVIKYLIDLRPKIKCKDYTGTKYYSLK